MQIGLRLSCERVFESLGCVAQCDRHLFPPTQTGGECPAPSIQGLKHEVWSQGVRMFFQVLEVVAKRIRCGLIGQVVVGETLCGRIGRAAGLQRIREYVYRRWRSSWGIIRFLVFRLRMWYFKK
jgi:hypothetical protein